MLIIEGDRLTGCRQADVEMIVVPDGVTTIGARAFQRMPGLRRAMLPGSVRTIGEAAFEGCATLESVELSEGLRRLGHGCFKDCASLRAVFLPDTVASMHPCAFQGCGELREIQLSRGLRRNIERQTFGGCVSLERVRIPPGIEQIKAGAFSGCTGLKSVTLENPNVQIEEGAFRGCTELSEETLQFIAAHTCDNSAVQIKSTGSGALGRLSNFTERHFIFDGVPCASIEGVLQSFKCPDPVRQRDICALTGGWAKKAGGEYDWKTAQCLYWQGEAFPRRSQAYQQLLDRLYDAVFAQDEGFRADLAALGERKIDHRIGLSNPAETVLTRHEFVFRLQRLRERAMKSSENPAVLAGGWKNDSP